MRISKVLIVVMIFSLGMLTLRDLFAQEVAHCVTPPVVPGGAAAESLASDAQAVQRADQPAVDLSSVSAVLSTKGFKCEPPSPKEGLSCVGRIGSYPRDVAIMIPPGYRMTDDADTILHLHGNNMANQSIQAYMQQHHYGRLLASTGRNAVMIAPLSLGKTVDFEQQLADGPHFKEFMAATAALMKSASLSKSSEVGSVALTGHSGAYRALSMIVENGAYASKINELYLLDSGYGRAPAFATFALDPKHRFWTAYHPADKDFKEAHDEMLQRLKDAGQPPYEAPSAAVGDVEIRSNRVGFVHSDVGHPQTLNKYFAVFLKARP